MEQPQTHETSTSLVQADPGEVYAGMELALQVKVACSSACDLRGKTVRILAQDDTVQAEVELTTADETTAQTDKFVVKAPIEPGAYTWTALFPAQATEDDAYQESSASFSFAVKPHVLSMAVWDIPAPLVLDTAFKLKVGAKCSAGCNLAGETIEIYDHTGTKIATGVLGDGLYSETIKLHWAEVNLTSPAAKGTYRWEAKLATPGLDIPHAGAAFKFSFSAAEQPKYAVTIEVVNETTQAPVAKAHVVFRPYSGYTDAQGVLKLVAAADTYKLYITEEKYDSFETTVTVTGDTTLRVELTPARYEEDYRGNLWKVKRKK